MADFSISTLITADSSNFDKNVKKAEKSLNGFSGNIKSVTKLLSGMFAVTSMVALAKSIKEVSTEFSKATANIAKGTGATGEALQNLSKSVNNAMIMGVGRSASEVGSMIADLNTRFGVTDETLERMVDNFDKFASVTDTEVKTSINSVADLMAKWNVSLEDSDKLLDQLTVASQMSGASVTELSAGLKAGQSVLSQFGMSLTESTAFLASLSKNGVATGVALTGLRTALANFSADGKEASSAFKEVSDRIKNAKTQTEALQIATETFGARSGAEMVKILQTSATSTEEFTQALRNAGGALEETDRASRTSQDALEDLKATIQATFFSSGADTGLRDMIDGIAEAFRNINFAELKEQFSSIGLFLQGVWEQFKELFNNIKEAIDISGTNFGSWKEVIYNHLNAVYRILQDWVGGFSALLKGDFSLAWDYAKLALMRTADYMIDTISKLANSMPNVLNKFIDGLNKAIEKINVALVALRQDPIKAIEHIGKVDLSESLGLDKSIEELEKKIEKATGKIVDKTFKDLKQVSSNVKSTTKEITGEIGDIGESATTTTEEATDSWENFSDKVLEDCKTKLKDSIENTLATGLQAVGQSLADGSEGWEQFGQTALKALSDTVYAIGQQLMAQGTALLITQKYADAMVAFAGATTAIMASGFIAGMGKLAKNLNSSVSSIKAFKNELQGVLDSIKDTTTMFSGIETIGDSIKTVTEKLAESEQNLNKYASAVGVTTISQIENWLKYGNKWHQYFVDGEQESVAIVVQNLKKYKEEFKLYTNELKALYNSIYSAVNDYNEELLDSIDSSQKIIANYERMFDTTTAMTEALALYGETGEEVYNTLAKVYQKYAEVLYNVQLSSLESVRQGAYEDLLSTGTSIGENLVNSITEGATKSDFLADMKDYLTENIVKLAVYTESFNEKLAKIGSEMAEAIAQGADLTSIRTELETLYEEASANAEVALASLEDVFGDLAETVTGDTENGLKEINDYLEKLQVLIEDFEEEVGGIGTDIANSLISGIEEGLTNSDFIDNMYTYIRKLIIQTVVYTESMQAEIEAIGEAISKGLSEGFSANSLATIKQDLSNIFNDVSKQMADIDSVLEDVFGDLSDGVEETVKEIEKELTSLESSIKSFKESVTDLGGDIASNLISGLSNGLTDSDFLKTMYNYIRKLIVQTVVYTESMKSEIEAIGQTISEGLSSGFSADSLSTVRRDLSYIFYSANQQMAGIDSVLESVFSGYASGTENASRGLHLVGEAGPELVAFNGGEKVYNADETSRMLNGGNNFNVTFNNTQDTTAFAMIQQLRQYNREMAINGIF